MAIKKEEKKIQLLKAIEESRKNFKELKKDGKNPMFKNAFSTITNIFDSCKSALEENGINVSFHTYVNESLQRDILVLTLTHLPSGESKSSELILLDDTKKGAQAVGSAITYHRRYMLQAMLNLEADGETDDDGTQASHTTTTPRNIQAKKSSELKAGDLVNDYSYSGAPFRVWKNKQDMEIFSELRPYSLRLQKLFKDAKAESDEALKILKESNEKEVDRISKDIKDYQDKDQEWKDKATDLLSNIVNM